MTFGYYIKISDTIEQPSTLSRGNTLYVGGDGDGNYSTIQSAVNDANHGDTVFVYDDSSPYYENLTVYKSINLIGENRDTTIIDGNYSFYSIYVNANYVNILGFTIIHGSWSGIQLQGTIGGSIIENIISNNKFGIYLEYSNSNTIVSNNISSNNGDGIRIRYSITNTIKDNNILNNYFHGLSLELSSNNTIISNNFSSNRLAAIILEHKCNSNTITSNNINSNDGHAIFIDSGNSNTITDNNISNNNGDGIFLLDCSNCIVTGNNVFSNRISGNGIILYVSCNNNIIKGNVISLISEFIETRGISLSRDCSNNTITGNTISNNEYGIFLYDSSGNTVTGNTISLNNEDGIYLGHSKSNTIKGNIISNNKDGIYLAGYDDVGFDFIKIFYDGSNNNIILKNNFLGNERDAFFQNSFSNQWKQNYWNKPQILPKFISGEIYWTRVVWPWMSEIHIPWFPQIDWNPALEPYDI